MEVNQRKRKYMQENLQKLHQFVDWKCVFPCYTLTHMTNKKLLLVEDSEPLRNVLAEKLTDEHFEVMTAGGGEDGMKIAQDKKPDVIITDIVMFPMDGLEMVKKIRESGEWGKKVHVIALTNQNDSEEQGRLEALHLDAYLVKAETSLDDVVRLVKKLFTN
jgi:DNA-binding response OmpR family regulator